MGKIIVKDITISGKRIEISYIITEDITKYFFEARTFFAEYDDDISFIPKSIAIVPFLCDILPVVWVTDSIIVLDSIDEDFYNSIEKFKQGYINMYPSVSFRGNLHYTKLEKNTTIGNNTALFFSGGVDAFSSLIAHIEETPILVSLWGSDVKLDDFEGWENVQTSIKKVGEQFSLQTHFIKTNFRSIVNTGVITSLIQHTGEEWWHGFQHGIGLIGHVAPLAYVKGIKTTYIASSYTAEMPHTCASDPTIDNYVKFCGSNVVHDQYDYSRQMKVESICRYAKNTGQEIKLHVCWISSGGKNCCCCEKCYRTILAIIAAGNNPNDFGFHVDKKKLQQIEFDIKHTLYFAPITIVLWKEIQQSFINKYPNGHSQKELNWIYSYNFDEVNQKEPIPESILIKVRHFLGWIKRQFV